MALYCSDVAGAFDPVDSQLLVEKLCDEEIRNFDGDRYSYSSSESTQGEEDDIYEEMDVLQSYFENIYNSDYLEMGLV